MGLQENEWLPRKRQCHPATRLSSQKGQTVDGILSATQPVPHRSLGKEGGGWRHKGFPKLASGRGGGREGGVQRGAVFINIYVTGTGTSTNKIENLREIKKEHLVFKYAESYGS